MNQNNDFMTVPETAKYLRVSQQTVWNYLRKGLLVKSQASPGAAVRVTIASIEALRH